MDMGVNLARLNLNGSLVDTPVVNRGNLQRRLYNEVIWGCYNDLDIKISKLEVNVSSLFPVDSDYGSLEFISIDHSVLEDATNSTIRNKFILKINVNLYHLIGDVIFVGQRSQVDVPLMELPQLTDNDEVVVNGINRVLVSQLIKQSAVSLDRTDGIVTLKLMTNGGTHLTIENLRIKYADYYSGDLLTTLLMLKTKYVHILDAYSEVKSIAFFKGKWFHLDWTTSVDNKTKYGNKRRLRMRKIMGERCVVGRNDVVGVAMDHYQGLVKKTNGTMRFNSSFVTKYASVLKITKPSRLLPFIRRLVETNCVCKSEITAEHINNIDLTLAGRCFLNDLVDNDPGFGLDLITKKDLILIWNELAINNGRFKHMSHDIRMVRGAGDIIMEIVVKTLTKILDIEVIEADVNGTWIIDKLLTSNKQIQNDVNKFFNSSSLCQYLDQVNSLSELSHKNRLTCLGDGGLSSQNVEITIRDTKRWHFGRICPIESPEGQNVGLITMLAAYADIDVNGHITTAYQKVRNGLVSNNVKYLNHYESKRFNISLPHTQGLKKWVVGFDRSGTKVTDKNMINLSLITNVQVFSSTVCLIPFLGHNDPTRALMAVNMLKQAIPPLNPRPPLVGTGEEHGVMESTNHNVVACNNCVVIGVDSNRVSVFEPNRNKYRAYVIPKPKGSNQETCLRLRMSVYPNQVLEKGDVIADCQSSCDGEMSLGVNLLATFMCWRGYNYEDSVLISEDVINRGDFNSFHIVDVETKVERTKFGNEWLSNNIRGMSQMCLEHLDKTGIVKLGSHVREGDVLVGKLMPTRVKGTDLNSSDPFNGHSDDNGHGLKDKRGDVGGDKEDESNEDFVSNTSFRVPNGIEFATVLEVKRTPSVDGGGYQDGTYGDYVFRCNIVTKTYLRRCYTLLQQGETCGSFGKPSLASEVKSIKGGLKLLYKNYLNCLNKLRIDLLNKFSNRLANEDQVLSDQILEVIKIKLLVRRSIKVGDKICGRHGNKGVISRIVPKEDMPFMADGTPIDIVLNPLGVPSRMNIGQILEADLGLISYKFGLEFKQILNLYNKTGNDSVMRLAMGQLVEIYPNINNLSKETVITMLNELAKGVKLSCPLFDSSIDIQIKILNKRLALPDSNNEIQLYDGRTGLPFDKKSTVGIIYIYKLNHFIDDKMYARSTGPYSIVTQQPLKGKANKGGQRLGEMEVWALQSYGSVRFLTEALTAKSDDITARHELYIGALNGNPRFKSYQNEGMAVLLKELFAMCIDIETKI
ncbi:DNA-directed RNA polymerase subunit beta [Candidatus Hodgkinia cicadicola]|nr:DNA-directed RNA polymerase subunit beta [Candidatus Hodgkinia cicadicola]